MKILLALLLTLSAHAQLTNNYITQMNAKLQRISDNQTNGTQHATIDAMPQVIIDTSGLSTSAYQVTEGQKLDAIKTALQGALSVTGSFYQATQPVSGTLTCNAGSGTLAVSGPLTDAQLRASAVPVSGT